MQLLKTCSLYAGPDRLAPAGLTVPQLNSPYRDNGQPASKMRVQRLAIHKDTVLLYSRLQKWVWGLAFAGRNNEDRHNSTNTHPKNAFYVGNSMPGQREAFGTSPEPQNGPKTIKTCKHAGLGPLRQLYTSTISVVSPMKPSLPIGLLRGLQLVASRCTEAACP